jgi:hypothetical protein
VVGFAASDFELQEEVFDPQTAEVEARKGDVGVRRLGKEAVVVYPLGDGSDWVAALASDLAGGRFRRPAPALNAAAVPAHPVTRLALRLLALTAARPAAAPGPSSRG